MDLQILSDKKNDYFNRREVEFSVISEGPTPKKEEVLKELCKKLNINPDFAIITNMTQGFGMSQSSGVLHSYQSKEELSKQEQKYLLERINKKAGKQAGEAVAANQDKKEGTEQQK